MKKNEKENFIEIKITKDYTIKKSIKKINEERINPKIWDWCYLNLKPILNEVIYFVSKLKEDNSRNVLDLGCGTKPYNKLFDFTNKYIGFDVQKNEKVDYIGVNWKLPFGDDEFDSLMSTQVLEHTEEICETIKEIKRVVKNNGLIFISVPFVFPEHEIPNDFFRFSRYGIQKIFRDFDILKITPSNGYFGTIFLAINTVIHYIPGSSYFAFPIFFLNNACSLAMDLFFKIFFKLFNSGKMRDIYEYYYLGFPANYAVLFRNKK